MIHQPMVMNELGQAKASTSFNHPSEVANHGHNLRCRAEEREHRRDDGQTERTHDSDALRIRCST